MSDIEAEDNENDETDLNNKNLDQDMEKHEDLDAENDKHTSKPNRDFNRNSEKQSEKNEVGENDNNNEIEMDDENESKKDNNDNNKNESKTTDDSLGNNNKISSANLNQDEQDTNEDMEKNMGQKNENRVQSDDKKEFNSKNFNILNENDNENETNNENRLNNENDTELDSAKKNIKQDFKHIKNANEKFDASVYDAATENQKRKIDQQQDKQFDEDIESNNSKKRHLDKDEEKIEEENDVLESKKPETHKNKKKNAETKESLDKNPTEIKEEVQEVNMDNFVSTIGVDGRPAESFFDTSIEKFEFTKTREELEIELSKFRETENYKLTTEQDLLTYESIKLWLEYEAITQQLSKELCEQLRLILEPTVCSKLKGDYKTGKRLNMKRVVEYIATEYRKDKIWLRRTKPNKRDYEILLAVDNSCSMSDNHCIQLAYETIATLSNAFQYLEVGKFGLLSFGEKVNQLLDLQEQFNSDIGAKVLSQINFKDDKTNIAQVCVDENSYLTPPHSKKKDTFYP